MVAITVLLASTAAVFFLELGNETGSNTTPTASFQTDYDDETSDSLTFSHNAGDKLKASELTLVVDDVKGASGTISGVNGSYAVDTLVSDTKLGAGSSITVSKSTFSGTSADLDFSEARLKLVWEGSGSGQSTVIADWTGPDA